MKTAVSVLQELMIQNNEIPEYECISQSGPQHQAMFEYRCVAEGVTVMGQARSKKEAKQEAARKMLSHLYSLGHEVPAPFNQPPLDGLASPPSPTNNPALEAGGSRGAAGGVLDTRSYVALLRELCEEYRLGEVAYELVGDAGPPHLRHFTVVASLGQHERSATYTTKKAARQLAAEQLYTYLRENLARLTKDFSEEQALQRAQEKSKLRARTEAALARYAEGVGEVGGEGGEPGDAGGEPEDAGGEAVQRPDLGQRVAQYHLGLRQHLGDETCQRGLQAIKEGLDPEGQLQDACDAMGLRIEHEHLGTVAVVLLVPSAPPLAFAGTTRGDAVRAALRYMRRALPADGALPAEGARWTAITSMI